jgi:hypothetical protein
LKFKDISDSKPLQFDNSSYVQPESTSSSAVDFSDKIILKKIDYSTAPLLNLEEEDDDESCSNNGNGDS